MTLSLDRSDWRKVKFSEVAENVNDRVDDPKSAGVSRYVGLEHLDPGSLTITRWGTPDQVEATKLRFKPGDVIFGRRRAYQKKVARADFEGICSAHAMVLRAKPGVVDPDFLPVFLSSDYFLDRAIKISVGSLSPTVNWKTLAVQEFELPALDQQRRIADLLWSLEYHRSSIEKQKAAIGTVSSRWVDVQVMQYVTADPRTVGDCLASGLLRLLTGPFGTALSARAFESGGTPVIHPANIRDGRIEADLESTVPDALLESVAKWRVVPGDVVMMRKGDVGRSAIVTSDEDGWILSSDCISVRSLDHGRLLPTFVQLVLAAPRQQSELMRRAPGTTMPGINERSLSPLAMPVAPIEVQHAFCEEHATLIHGSHNLTREVEALNVLRRGLLAELAGSPR